MGGGAWLPKLYHTGAHCLALLLFAALSCVCLIIMLTMATALFGATMLGGDQEDGEHIRLRSFHPQLQGDDWLCRRCLKNG